MAAPPREVRADKGKATRRDKDGADKQGCGDDRHILIGPTGSGKDQRQYRSLVHFPMNFGGVKTLIKAEIAIKTEDDSTHFEVGSSPEVWVHRLTESFSSGNNGENNWTGPEYENPSHTGTVKATLPLNYDYNPPRVFDGQWIYIDVTYLIQPIVPDSVFMPNGQKGGGHADKRFGFMLRAPGEETSSGDRMVFYSDKAGNNADRPRFIITYDPVNRQPTAPSLSAPPTSGTVGFQDEFTGQHNDPDGDPMKARFIEVREVGKTKIVWSLPSTLQSAGSDETQFGIFSVPLSAAAVALKLGTHYEWRAATQDSNGAPKTWKQSDGDDQATFSGWRALTITSSAPTIVASDVGTVATMAAVKFGGVFNDPDGSLLQSFEIQMQAVSAHTDAAFADPLQYIWATGETLARADEVQHVPPTISRDYAGQALAAGTYTYRIRASDLSGVWSPWSYDDFPLTEVFDPSPGPDDPEDPNDIALVTQVQRNAPVRVALYTMDGANGRKRGTLIGHLDDPMDLGASAYLNSGGEVYFTLPALHPYCPVLEPHKTHYAIEQWYGDRYRELPFSGIITDFEADADTAVFYGTDYLGLLQSAVDARFNANNDRSPANGTGGGGSYYSDKTIDYIIKDQLRYHKAAANSPVGFITIGSHITALAERATIHSTYSEALPFITGLIDSHKQGTGREARLYVKPNASYSAWEWYLTDNWGKDRDNIRLEWGGLLNDFRVIALGDFATRVLAVGQKRGEVKVYRATGTGGFDESAWGRRAATRFYAEILDQNDLQRRANEAACALAKIGKRIALALRADMLAPFDGWDLGDNIVIDIDRGVVQTKLYGSNGYWKILGVEWRYFADGHSDMTWTVTPKEVLKSAPPELIPSINPGVANDWQVGYGVPTVYGNPPSPTP